MILGGVFLAFGLVSILTEDATLVAVHLVLGIALIVQGLVQGRGDLLGRMRGTSFRRGAWLSTNAAVQTLAVVAIFVLGSYLVNRHPIHWDFTEARIFTLSDASKDVLAQIPEERRVEAYAFFSEPRIVRARLDQYTYESERFSYKIIDPRSDPVVARKLDIDAPDQLVICGGPCETATSTVKARDLSEQKITEAIRSVISQRRKVYFVIGHGEAEPTQSGPESAALFGQQLGAENIEHATLLLAQTNEVPEDADAVILAGPRLSLFERESKALDEYVRRGGSLLVLSDALQDAKLGDTLREWSIELGSDVIITPQRFVADVFDYAEHPITEDLQGLPSTFSLARSVRPASGAESQVVVLARTEQNSFAVPQERVTGTGELFIDADQDERGPIPLAVARTFPSPGPGEREGRLVVVGDADFIRDPYLVQAANADLALNMVSWLVGEDGFITIDRSLPRASRIRIADPVYRLYSYLGILLLPETLLIAGIVTWWRRRTA
jgi:ABC-type uncharacterized transport system involved in gliding motility auxiliary subunit